ncbi:MAG: hypothetical protein Q7R93_02945 [bacterium]|nr:hypothetical protein [bacterium]
MADNIDLNALRTSLPEQQKETREQKIGRLTQEITELEAKVQGPNDFALFTALPPEKQAAMLAEVNEGALEEEKYTSVAEYTESLRPKGPNIYKMRLEMKRAELEALVEG